MMDRNRGGYLHALEQRRRGVHALERQHHWLHVLEQQQRHTVAWHPVGEGRWHRTLLLCSHIGEARVDGSDGSSKIGDGRSHLLHRHW
jgi:hypothetical protein